MKVKIKKLHPSAVIPKYAKPGDAGMDLTATKIDISDIYNLTYHTGIAIEIPEGYVGLLFPRSSVYKTGMKLTNSVGVIDSGYRGEIMFKYSRNLDSKKHTYEPGERVGQLIIIAYPCVEFEEVDNLTDTDRAGGGFGSTGN